MQLSDTDRDHSLMPRQRGQPMQAQAMAWGAEWDVVWDVVWEEAVVEAAATGGRGVGSY